MNGRPISGASVGVRARRTRGATSLVLGAMLVALTACGSGGDGAAEDGKGGGGKPAAADRTAPSKAVVSIAPKDGAKSVATSGALKVTAEQGKLSSVKVSDTKGNEIEGTVAKDGASWKPAHHLAAATEYRVHAVAKDGEGRESAKDQTFTTLVPENTFVGHFTPEDGSKVGVGMPVSLRFTRGITAPEAVERAVTVTAEPKVEIRSQWYGNDRLDFRPEEYWRPGTEVTVDLALRDVEGAPGVFGLQRKAFTFTVGRSQVSTVDAAAHTMRVVREGEEPALVPVTAGAPETPTYNGKMVVTEMLDVTRMDGSTVGFGGEYDIPDVPHAIRLSRSGTFLHGNYWADTSVFGHGNVSHGCVGLRDVKGGGRATPARWFYDRSLIGDVVEVVNSDDRTVAPDNGLGGWNLDWRAWRAGSALG